MLDIYSQYHFDPKQQQLLRSFINLLQAILDLVAPVDPTRWEHANNVLSVLVGWLPLDAGNGGLQIDARGIGSVEVLVDKDNLSIAVIPDFPCGLQSRVLKVLVTGSTGAMNAEREKTRCSLRILKCALRRLRADGSSPMMAGWKWNDGPRPSAMWEERRAEALRAGAEPPRAVHWLRDSKILTNPSTTMMQVQYE